MIANVDCSARGPIYERIEAEVGTDALYRIKELVGAEVVRQKLLREGKQPCAGTRGRE